MDEHNSAEWQAPPPPELIVREEPQMSEVSTLANIFLEPGRTFEDLKTKPRFIIAMVIMALLVTAYGFGLYYKVGDASLRRFFIEQMDRSAQPQGLSAERKNSAVEMQMTIGSLVRFAMPVLVAIVMLIGGLLYWAAAKAFGGTGGFFTGFQCGFTLLFRRLSSR